MGFRNLKKFGFDSMESRALEKFLPNDLVLYQPSVAHSTNK